MKIRFMDGEEIDVLRVYGGPKLVNGVTRDVLRIEVDTNTITFDKLRSLFENNPNAMVLHTDSISPTESGGVYVEDVKMAEGYTIFISQTIEDVKVPHTPGLLEPDTTEHVFVVLLAQMTYEEYQASKGA